MTTPAPAPSPYFIPWNDVVQLLPTYDETSRIAREKYDEFSQMGSQKYNETCQTAIEKRDMLWNLILSLPGHYEELSKSNFAKQLDAIQINKRNSTNLTGIYAGYCLSKGQYKRTMVSLALGYGMAEDVDHLKMINTLAASTAGAVLISSGVKRMFFRKPPAPNAPAQQPVNRSWKWFRFW